MSLESLRYFLWLFGLWTTHCFAAKSFVFSSSGCLYSEEVYRNLSDIFPQTEFHPNNILPAELGKNWATKLNKFVCKSNLPLSLSKVNNLFRYSLIKGPFYFFSLCLKMLKLHISMVKAIPYFKTSFSIFCCDR